MTPAEVGNESLSHATCANFFVRSFCLTFISIRFDDFFFSSLPIYSLINLISTALARLIDSLSISNEILSIEKHEIDLDIIAASDLSSSSD